MTSNTVFIKTYPAPRFNIDEILRYAGCKDTKDEFLPLIEECIKECDSLLSYKVCYGIFPIKTDGNGIRFTFASEKSSLLSRKLAGCDCALVFGATIGIEIDRLIAKYGRISPSKALFFQALGAERIESLCNAFCDDIQTTIQPDGLFLQHRFSPGYGDFPLSFQKEIFRVLDCHRKIGLSLNESLLMSPSKSVTAIAGISRKICKTGTKNCGSCNKTDCLFKKM